MDLYNNKNIIVAHNLQNETFYIHIPVNASSPNSRYMYFQIIASFEDLNEILIATVENNLAGKRIKTEQIKDIF